MNNTSPRLVSQLRYGLLLLLFSGMQYAGAQNSTAPHFFINFIEANPTEHQFVFKTVTVAEGTFDFVVFQTGNEMFRFRNIDARQETPYSFILVNDKNKALEGLKLRNTLTNYSNFGFEISAAFENKDVAYIGILECTTKDGATSRLQIARMVLEEESIGSSTGIK